LAVDSFGKNPSVVGAKSRRTSAADDLVARITITAVPEPSSFALLFAAVVGFGVVGRR
jgi:hypothetical protein